MPIASAPLSSEAIIAELGFTPSDDGSVVHLTGNETIAGVKTFSTPIADGSIASAATWNAKQDALGFTPENVANKATNFATVNDTLYPTVAAVKAYADALVVGLVDDRGNFDASGNTFPASGGSGTAGAILKGDLWVISVAGTLGGVAVAVGDQVRALVDTPGQTAGNWAISEANIGFVPENVANKATSFSTVNNTLYPTTQAVANYAQPASAVLDTYAGIAPSANVQTLLGAANFAAFKTSLSLNLVENTALSTWAGSTNIVTLGTVTSGGLGAGAVLGGVTMTLGSDADGDIYYRASNVLTRLPKGTAGQVLTMNAGATAPEWATPSSGGSPAGSDGDYQVKSGSGFASGVIVQGANGRPVITPTAATTGVQPYFRVVAPADTGQTADGEFIGMVFGGSAANATVTRTGADGTTIALQREAVFIHPTYAFAGATTLTIAATLAITGAPVAGSNATITNAYSFYVAAGLARFSGGITSPGGTQSEKFGAGTTTATGSFAVSVGNTAQNGSDNGIVIGALSTLNASCDGGIVIGSQSGITASSGGAIVIGKVAGTGTGSATGANSISIGIGAVAKTANTMVVGGSSQPINTFYGGKGENHATPVSFTLSGTHGLGTDISGADIIVQAGLPTGTGNGGAIIFKGALPAGSTGSTRQTAEEWARLSSIGVLAFPATMTAGGTTGNQTINKVSGSVNFAAAGGTTLTVTNNKVAANSIVLLQVMTNDATLKSVAVVVSAGSFVIHANAAATGETKVAFLVLNQ